MEFMAIFKKKTWAAFFIMCIVFLFLGQPVAAAPEHFTFKMTYTPVRFHGTLQFFGQAVAPGDEIGIFDENVLINNGCIGATVIEESGLYIVNAYGDDPATPGQNGALPGDSLYFKLWRAGDNTIYDLETVGGGEALWTTSKINDFVEVDLTTIQGAVTAGFTFSAADGCVPFEVQFTDTSQGDPTSWSWNFGDGGTGTEQNPIHTFNSGGSFEVILVASNGTDTHAINQVIQVSSPPIAQFIGSHFNGVMPLTVEFMDQSQGVPTSWVWNFGDGTASEIQNPSHTYTEAGTYTVSLQVANECGEDLKEAENDITVSSDGPPSIDAAFTLNITEGCSPSVVSFFDASTRDPNGSPIISWLWNFGDGETSTEQDPNHEYTWPGAYTVRLIIQNAFGETDMYERLVDIQTRSEAAFSTNAIYVCPNTPVQFTDESSGAPTHWKWSFGDGESSTESDPVHRYKDPGTYTVRLTVFSLCGVSVKQEAGYIVVRGKPGADFQAEQILLCADLTMEFTDQSSNDAENWVWDFGDGATGSGQNSVHTYDQAGTYEVTLTASNGCDSSAVTKEVMVLGPPVADITVPVSFALPNQQIQFNDSSIGIPNLWLWEFGDGEESTIQNPVHAYTSPGKYTLKLGVKNSCGSAVITKTILVGNQSQAYFAIGSDTACTNVNIQFTNISDPDFDTWLWDFGDGLKSNEKDPNHSFSSVGDYLVRLTASNEFSSHEYEEIVIVEETPLYSVDVSEGCAPLTVQFQDLSAGASECLWDFGDGSTSTERNPTHTYAEPGIYIVDLSYSNGCSSAWEAENAETITVEDLLLADFEVDKLIGPAPLRVQFQDQSIGSGASNWDFGDGEGSAEQNPSHTYQNPGFHEVSLTAARGNCKQEKVLKGIDVYNPGLIKGQVLDSETNQPISGASVQVLGQANQSLSNANGDYSIPNLRAGYYAVRVSTDEYESALVQEIQVKPSEQTNQDIYLNSAEGNISGVITGSDANPIAGAAVVALYTGDGGPYSCQAATEQDGKYTVYIGRVGAFKLVASADGFIPKTDDKQGAGYVIDPDNGAGAISGCNISLEPLPWASDIKICSLETESRSGSNQGDRQTKIIISMDPNFDGDVSVDFDPEVMGENAVGMLSFPQLIDGNRPYYEVVYSDYKGNDVERVGVSIKVNVGSGSITLPYIFTVNSGSASEGELYLKGISKNITPAEGGTSYELGWIDLDGDEQSDQYDASFVEISPCSIVDARGNADFEISPLMICLNRVSNPAISDVVAIYNIELLDEKGEALEDFQVNPDNPIIVHLHCNSVFLGTNAGNLAIKYRDGEGVWREDGIKNVHTSYDMLSFTVTHLTSFALLTVHSAPSHVVVQAVSETQIDLAWGDNSEGEIGFEVWRCDNNNPGENKNYSRLTITDPNVTSYSDVSCQMDNTYNYKIRAVTELGATSYSIPAGKVLNDCAFAPKAPQNLRIRSVSSKEVFIEWTDVSSCESGFDIYRRTGKNAAYGKKPIGTSPADETTYKDTDVSAGQTYYYMVKATSDEGDSDPSDELMVAIPGASAPAPGPVKGSGGICFLSALNSCGSSLGRWIAEKIQVITQ